MKKRQGKACFQLNNNGLAFWVFMGDRNHICRRNLALHLIAQRSEMRFDGAVEIGFFYGFSFGDEGYPELIRKVTGLIIYNLQEDHL